MDRLRNNGTDADVKDDQEDLRDNCDQSGSSYYYDDTTGYEIYRQQEENEGLDSDEAEP